MNEELDEELDEELEELEVVELIVAKWELGSVGGIVVDIVGSELVLVEVEEPVVEALELQIEEDLPSHTLPKETLVEPVVVVDQKGGKRVSEETYVEEVEDHILHDHNYPVGVMEN